MIKNWRNWGDHPVIVILGAIATIGAIGSLVVTVLNHFPRPAPPDPGTMEAEIPAALLPDDPALRDEVGRISLPSNRHRELGRFIGEWDIEGEMIRTDGQRYVKYRGTDTVRWIYGRRFVEHRIDLIFDKQHILSSNFRGFDNDRLTYTSVSLDSISTGLEPRRGRMLDRNRWVWSSSASDEKTERHSETTITFVNDSVYTSESVVIDGKERIVIDRATFSRKRRR